MEAFLSDNNLPIFFTSVAPTKGQMDQLKNVFRNAINSLHSLIHYDQTELENTVGENYSGVATLFGQMTDVNLSLSDLETNKVDVNTQNISLILGADYATQTELDAMSQQANEFANTLADLHSRIAYVESIAGSDSEVEFANHEDIQELREGYKISSATNYKEISYDDNGDPMSIDTWVDDSKETKLFTKTITVVDGSIVGTEITDHTTNKVLTTGIDETNPTIIKITEVIT